MISNGKLSDRAKKCIAWVIAICVLLLCVTFCIRACQRNVECHIDTSRNRVTIQYISPDDIVKPSKKR